MPRIEITDLDDPRLNPFRSLKQTNETRWTGEFIAEGEKLVERMLVAGLECVSIVADSAHADRLAGQIPPEVPVYVIPTRWIDSLIGFHFHRGILACGKRPTIPHWRTWLAPPPAAATLVLCPDIKDPENLGAIIRISAAFEVQGVLVGSQSADPYSRRVLRVSMGTVFQLPVLSVSMEADLWSELHDAGFELIATVLAPDAKPLTKVQRGPRIALLLGSEGYGLSEQVIAACDQKWTIPMASGVDSLNVAVSAGIFLHHLQRTPGETRR